MALEMNYLDRGLNVPRCYVKVSSVNSSKERAIATVTYQVVNGSGQDKKFFEAFASESFDFTPSVNNENFIAQAYKHLKTLSKFSNSQDC